MYIDKNGRTWLKGNLHTHTTRSDGRRSPEDTVALYRENGYDFIALTDHWTVSETRDGGGILELSGCEYDIGGDPRAGIYHIVGAGLKKDPQLKRGTPAQDIIDAIRDAGGFPILAHPAWSLNDPASAAQLKNLGAVEIFNSVSDLPCNCRPYSGSFCDLLALCGVFLPLVATDDTHFYRGEQCRSYIMVRADKPDPDEIFAAVVARDFYATQGPLMTVTQSGRDIAVDCTPCVSVAFFSDSVWSGRRAVYDENGGITHAEYKAEKSDTFVRVEIRDKDGRYAWSSYINL